MVEALAAAVEASYGSIAESSSSSPQLALTVRPLGQV